MSNTIEVIHVEGSDYECGVQAGQKCRNTLHDLLSIEQQSLVSHETWDDIKRKAQHYISATRQSFPHLIEQIEGMAEGANIPFKDLFPLTVEEVFDISPEKCTDVVVSKPHPVIGHNNDSSPEYMPLVTAIIWKTQRGDVLTVGVGPFMSIGVSKNPQGQILALSGNELTQNDQKNEGIPRYFVALGALNSRNFSEAVKTAIHPDRASSYNLIIADANRVVNVEGSATNARVILPDENNHIIHTNNYQHSQMEKHDRNPKHIGSAHRLRRARTLSQDIDKEKPVIPQLKHILKDHDPEHTLSGNTICKHDVDTKRHTIFSAITDVGGGTIEISLGPPCRNDHHILWQFGK